MLSKLGSQHRTSRLLLARMMLASRCVRPSVRHADLPKLALIRVISMMLMLLLVVNNDTAHPRVDQGGRRRRLALLACVWTDYCLSLNDTC